jgi:hypothetical protein
MPLLHNVLTIPNATPSQTDAAQYMVYRGGVQYNLCGEMSAAYCLRERVGDAVIDDFLNGWKQSKPTWFETLFRNNLARTTGPGDIVNMIGAYAEKPLVVTTDYLKRFPFTADVLKVTLLSQRVIIGVQIDNIGYLVGKGIPHWVVLEAITDDPRPIVTIYNPFTNNQEQYSFRELRKSNGEGVLAVVVNRMEYSGT